MSRGVLPGCHSARWARRLAWQAGGVTTPVRDPRRWWVLAAAVGCLLAIGVDSGTVVLALPAVRRDLGLTFPAVVAALAVPALALGLLLAPATRLARSWGTRRVLLLGLLAVAAGSAAAAVATSVPQLLAARLLTGAAAAAVLPGALAALRAAFAEDHRERGLAIWAAFSGLLLVLGPLLAGLLLRHGWRPVFGLAAGLAVVALALTAWRVPATAVVATQRFRPRLAPLVVHACMAATVLLLSFALQDGRQHTALGTAVLLLPLTAGLLLVGPRADRRLQAHSPQRVVREGLLLSALALAGHALAGDPLLLPCLVLQGIGAALVVASVSSDGSRQLGTALGVVLAGFALPAADSGDLRVVALVAAGCLTGAALCVSRRAGSGAGRDAAAPARSPSAQRPPASAR